MTVVTVTTMHARPEAQDILLDALRAVTPPSLAEPGCVRYELHADTADPATFVVIAEWATPDALGEHVDLPHAEAFRQATADALAAPFTTLVLQPLKP